MSVVVTVRVVPVWTTLATWPCETCVRKNEYDFDVSAGDWMSHVYSSATVPITRISMTMPFRKNFEFNGSSASAVAATVRRTVRRV